MTTQAFISGQGISVDVNAALAADAEAAVAAAPGLRLVGWNIAESAGTPAVATFRIMHGATVAGGTVIAVIELAADKSENFWCWPGIACPNGLTIDRVAGTADVQLFHVTVI